MKFIVEKTEIKTFEDGFEYIAIIDKDGKDWYEELKKFKKDTLKVMYNKDACLVLSTHTDASMLAPTMAGDVVEEIKYQEVQVNPNLYFVDGKVIELQRYETVENGKVVFNKNLRIDEIKKELQEMKDKKIR